MTTQYLTTTGNFVSDVTEVEVTEVTETITVTEIIEYTEVDGVIEIVGRDVEVSDIVEVHKETRQFAHQGQYRGIAGITQVSETVDIVDTEDGKITKFEESSAFGQMAAIRGIDSRRFSGVNAIRESGRITEVDETNTSGQVAIVQGIRNGRITESRECGRITEVEETSNVGTIKEVKQAEKIDMDLEMEVDSLFFGQQSGVKAITSGAEVVQTRAVDTGARSSMYIEWNSTQSAQATASGPASDPAPAPVTPPTSTLMETVKIEEVVEKPQQVEVKATEGASRPRLVVDIEAEEELEAEKMFIYTGWGMSQNIEEPRSPTIAHSIRSHAVSEEPVTVYQQQRPPISQSNTNFSMTTLHNRSSYSESSGAGASTDYFKTPESCPPVPPLPAAYANRTLVNLNSTTPTGCTGQYRTTTIDQARRLMEVTAMSKRRSFKPFCRILLLAAFVVLLTLGIAAVLLAYIWSGKIEANYWQIVTAVPQGSVLLITTFATKVIIVCIPFLLAIMAYYIATAWAMRNASVTQVERRGCGCVVTRTPDNQTTVIANEEYGLLLGMLKGATIFTLWSTIRYYIFRTNSSQRKAASKPLIQAFSVLLMALIILYCVMGLDFALHHISTTDYIPMKGPAIPAALLPSTNSTLYGRALKTECLSPNSNGVACTVTTQTVLEIPAFNTTTSFQTGLQTLAGLSTTDIVALAPFQNINGSAGQMALLVDNSHPVDEAFIAKTIGVYTQCEVISPYCDMTTDCDANHSPPTTHPNITARAPTCTAFSCSKPDWPVYWDQGMTNGTSFFLSEPLELRNDPALYALQAPPSYLATDRSLFRVFTSLGSYVDPSTLQNVCTQRSASGVCIKGNDDGYVYSSQTPIEPTPFYRKVITACTVNIVDVEYEHFDGKYTVRQDTAQPSNNATALALSSVLYTTDARTTAIGVTLAGLATSNAQSSVVASTMETSISRMMLAMGHAAFEAIPATDVVFTINAPITILPTPLIAAFVAFLVLFSLLTIALAVLALFTINKSLWLQRNRMEKSPVGQPSSSAPAAPAQCDSDAAHEAAPRPSPLRSSTMPAPTRLYSDKTVVGNDDHRAQGYL